MYFEYFVVHIDKTTSTTFYFSIWTFSLKNPPPSSLSGKRIVARVTRKLTQWMSWVTMAPHPKSPNYAFLVNLDLMKLVNICGAHIFTQDLRIWKDFFRGKLRVFKTLGCDHRGGKTSTLGISESKDERRMIKTMSRVFVKWMRDWGFYDPMNSGTDQPKPSRSGNASMHAQTV